MRKTLAPLLVIVLLPCVILSVNSQEKTRNPFAVGFQFDKFYYEPNSTGNVKIWVMSWIDAPLFIGAIFLHFDWMEENESISLVGLNVSVNQYEPTIVGSLNFTIPDVEPGWHGYVALVYYSAKLGGRWIEGAVRAPDPVDQREFGHDMYLISIGYPIGEGNVPALYWNVYNYTREVRRGEFLTVWVDLGNAGGYYAPSIHATLINDLNEVVGGIRPANIFSGIAEPYPLLFLSEGVPFGIRARLFWRIPENYSLGSHNITLIIASGEIPQASKSLNFTVLKSYSEEAREKLDIIDRFLREVNSLLNLSKQIGFSIKKLDVSSIRDEYTQGLTLLLIGNEKSALEHAEKGMQLVYSTKEQLKPLVEEIEKQIAKISTSEDPTVKEHLKKATNALEQAKLSENPANWAANMTIALSELLQAKNLVGNKWISLILAIFSGILGTLVLFIIIRRRK